MAERSLTLYFAFFYACGFLLVMSVSGMIILVATNMKKKSLVRITIVRFVGTLLFLFQTVLYLPIISNSGEIYAVVAMYILIASCDSNNFGLMISGLKCWNLEYQAHFSLGILFLVLEVIQVFPTTLLFYENTCSPANAFAKISPHAEVRSLAFKALLTVCALLFNEVSPLVSSA
ncbi:MAG: hypothetical protein P4M11_04360 [Candidatus Pacebacteria bacterium]|nr:hypothetical protein [Candidatus Paceibacterota bacterium]